MYLPLFTASVGDYSEEEHPANYTEEFQRYFYAKKEAIVRVQPTRIAVDSCVVDYASTIQWDLFIEDTLGPACLSTVERLSTLQS